MEEPRWGLLIVSYLFLGGLSAGLFFVSALATYLQDGRPARLPAHRPARRDARAVAGGHRLVPAHLRPRALVPLLQALPVTSSGTARCRSASWLLVGFTLLSLAYVLGVAAAGVIDAVVSRLPKRLRVLGIVDLARSRERSRRPLAMAGFPLAVGVGIYTGVLLGAVQARPFWNTNLVAQMFLFSALSTGCAALILALSLHRDGLEARRGAAPVQHRHRPHPARAVHRHARTSSTARCRRSRSSQALALILGGPYTFAFWVLFLALGLLLPLALELWEMRPVLLERATPPPRPGARRCHRPRWSSSAASCCGTSSSTPAR